MKHTIRTAFILLFSFTGFLIQMNGQSSDNELTKKEQQRTIDSIRVQLKANYIFPDIAEEMGKLLGENIKEEAYKTILDPEEFASRLTEDLQSVSKDLHLRVLYAPDQIAEMNNAVSDEEQEALEQNWIEQMKRNNFGFKETKIMEGNIGYLDLRQFVPTAYAGETAVAAMNFLSNSDALIIDLRNNGGGSPSMIQLITSYLYDTEPVHLNNFYFRPTDENTQTWTLPHVPGKRRPDMIVYVLTSQRTFSAAEEFSYNLRNLERAILIGETTGGGAHPGGTVNVTDKYQVWIPSGRAINPISETNWEGKGVKPHIAVPAEQALKRAHLAALDTLIKSTDDELRESFYHWYLDALKLDMNPVTLDNSQLQLYVGQYGPRNISMKDGQLYYQREGRNNFPLKPMGNHMFVLEGLDSFRIEFAVEDGKTVALIGHYDNGRSDKNMKDCEE